MGASLPSSCDVLPQFHACHGRSGVSRHLVRNHGGLSRAIWSTVSFATNTNVEINVKTDACLKFACSINRSGMIAF